MASLSRTELLHLARAGAQARVGELRRELDMIYRSFPDLRRGRPSAVRSRTTRSAAAPRKIRRKRRAWSAAQRRAVAARMKKYWAARRAGQKK